MKESGRVSFNCEVPTLIVFYHENRAVHVVHSKKGPLESIRFSGPGKLDSLARDYGVDRIICLETGALRRVAADAQARIRYDQPLWGQLLAARAALGREWGSGIHLYPDPTTALPDIPELALKLFRRLLPPSFFLVVAAFTGDTVWTSLMVKVEGGEVTTITTTDSLGPLDIKDLNIEEKSTKISRVITARWGAATAGFYMERTAFQQIIAHPRPVSALARLVHRKWVVVTPFPLRMRVLLAIGKMFRM